MWTFSEIHFVQLKYFWVESKLFHGRYDRYLLSIHYCSSLTGGRVCDKGLCLKTEQCVDCRGQPVKMFLKIRLCVGNNITAIEYIEQFKWIYFNVKLKRAQTYKATVFSIILLLVSGILCMYWDNWPGVWSFCWNFTEDQILWSLCLVDFYTLTLQLPIQTIHSVVPQFQVFVSSLKFSVKWAHPWQPLILTRIVSFLH